MKWILVAAIAIIGPGGAYAAWYWYSQPQVLKRACQSATWQTLVAPSTAKLLSFEISSQPTIARSKFEKQVHDTEAKLAENTEAQAQITSAQKNVSSAENQVLARHSNDIDAKVAVTQRALDDQNKLLERSVKLITENIRLSAQLTEAKSVLEHFDAQHFGEIVLTFDSQNRASALLRMQSVCTFHPNSDSVSTAQSVKFFEAAESGSL